MSKRNFIIFLVVAFLIAVGAYAYASGNEMIDINDYVDTFTPTSWKPGDTVKKEVKIKNTTNRLLVARISLNQRWVNKNGDVIDTKQNGNDTVLFDYDKNNFILDGSYYYYKKVLNPKEEVTFLRSITFNPKITNDYVCITEEKDGKRTQKCDSTGNGYDDAKYTLVTHIETLDYEEYKSKWNTIIDISK